MMHTRKVDYVEPHASTAYVCVHQIRNIQHFVVPDNCFATYHAK